MLTKTTTIALATALILSAAAAALADDKDNKGGFRTFGPGGGASTGINSVYHQQAAAACAKKYKSYDPTDMTYLGKDGKRHPCGT